MSREYYTREQLETKEQKERLEKNRINTQKEEIMEILNNSMKKFHDTYDEIFAGGARHNIFAYFKQYEEDRSIFGEVPYEDKPISQKTKEEIKEDVQYFLNMNIEATGKCYNLVDVWSLDGSIDLDLISPDAEIDENEILTFAHQTLDSGWDRSIFCIRKRIKDKMEQVFMRILDKDEQYYNFVITGDTDHHVSLDLYFITTRKRFDGEILAVRDVVFPKALAKNLHEALLDLNTTRTYRGQPYFWTIKEMNEALQAWEDE